MHWQEMSFVIERAQQGKIVIIDAQAPTLTEILIESNI
jgi:hypothetical protein